MSFVSYAQNFEDVMLWRALKNVPDGFYIDIGAQDPVKCSVSLGFHLRGWGGIHVEPIPCRAAALRRERPGDLVLETAIGELEGRVRFFEFPDADGLSTCDEDIAEKRRAEGFTQRERYPAYLCRSFSTDMSVARFTGSRSMSRATKARLSGAGDPRWSVPGWWSSRAPSRGRRSTPTAHGKRASWRSVIGSSTSTVSTDSTFRKRTLS